MTTTVAEAFVTIRPDVDKFTQETESKVGRSMQSVGRSMTRTITPAAVAVGAAFHKAFSEFDSGVDAIRAGTGATGKALDDLTRSMKNVGGQVIQPLSQVGAVMADLNTRTGLTGKSLETLTKQMLDLDRLGNTASVEAVTRVFGDWGIATENQSASLDKLFRASQATGPSVDQLGAALVQFGAPLRQLGFDFETSTALIGKFEKEGVNTELVLGSMRIALGKMARDGEDAQSTFQRITEEIKNAGSASEANTLALELFGARAGPDMAAAIREGRFELGDLVDQIRNGSETIASASEDTLDWSDKLAMLKNRVIGVVGPFGEAGMAIAGIAAAAGPTMTVLGKMGSWLSSASGSSGLLGKFSGSLSAVPWGAFAVAGAAAVGVLVLWNQRQQEAEQRVRALTEALRADNGALGENTKALIVNRFERAGVTDELARAGITVDDLTAAVQQNTGAYASNADVAALLTAQAGKATLQSEAAADKLREEGGARNAVILKLYEQGELTGNVAAQLRKLWGDTNAANNIERDRARVMGDTTNALLYASAAARDYAGALDRIPRNVTTTVSQVFRSSGPSPIRRAHSGGHVDASWPTVSGLRSDERPAILQVGETVVPKDRRAARGDVHYHLAVHHQQRVDVKREFRRMALLTPAI